MVPFDRVLLWHLLLAGDRVFAVSVRDPLLSPPSPCAVASCGSPVVVAAVIVPFPVLWVDNNAFNMAGSSCLVRSAGGGAVGPSLMGIGLLVPGTCGWV